MVPLAQDEEFPPLPDSLPVSRFPNSGKKGNTARVLLNLPIIPSCPPSSQQFHGLPSPFPLTVPTFRSGLPKTISDFLAFYDVHNVDRTFMLIRERLKSEAPCKKILLFTEALKW